MINFLKKNYKKILIITGIVVAVVFLAITTTVGIVNKDFFHEVTFEKYNKLAEKVKDNPYSNIELNYVRTYGSTEDAFGQKVDVTGTTELTEYYTLDLETTTFSAVDGSTKKYISYAKKEVGSINDDDSYTYYKGMFGKFKYVTIDNDSTYSQTRYTGMYNKFGRIIYYSYESWTQNSTSGGEVYYYYQKEQYFVTWSK